MAGHNFIGRSGENNFDTTDDRSGEEYVHNRNYGLTKNNADLLVLTAIWLDHRQGA